MIAEIQVQVAHVHVHGRASMGPRSDDRGNIGLADFFGSLIELQWGRDRMIAEMLSRSQPFIAASCFNGAAIG